MTQWPLPGIGTRVTRLAVKLLNSVVFPLGCDLEATLPFFWGGELVFNRDMDLELGTRDLISKTQTPRFANIPGHSSGMLCL